ncbi:bifunctional 3'-5' exonuclease/DNA polymerase [Fodinicola feengrottensis]|uniref:DNA-directed DNA polymerase n=1 Tax=Fodinicola feengrottensis TaxID=435914 RepID=A0ABP4UKI5_9ACTN
MRVVLNTERQPALLTVDEAGAPVGPVRRTADVVAEVRAASPDTRWVWPDAVSTYRPLLAAGVRVQRCHDLALTEALLLGYDGRWGQPRAVAAAWARLTGHPVPADPEPAQRDAPASLFEPDRTGLPPEVDPLEAARLVFADQQRRIAALPEPGKFRLLVAADSAGALVAEEMGRAGLPWRTDVHDALLAALLGGRTPPGVRPTRLAELANQVGEALGNRSLNPDSPAEVLRAFGRAGHPLENTRSAAVKQIDHPAVEPLLEYKELARIFTANGWAWQAEWVRDGRFRPEYVPAAVVSGRWATRGGGGLQIPRRLRKAVVAEDGWVLIVADAAQVDPRILAAMSGDTGMLRAAREPDLYSALAAEAFAGERAKAKLGLLGAMYGQTGGAAAAPLATLRRRYPQALELLEQAAQAGETGGLVRSWLGRTCPPGNAAVAEPSDGGVSEDGPPDRTSVSAARARGRFTRNFVVQATTAEWAGALIADLRTRLTGIDGAELVFYQHDEVMAHAPKDVADQVVTAIGEAAATATRLLFGATPARFPVAVDVVDCYADAAHGTLLG